MAASSARDQAPSPVSSRRASLPAKAPVAKLLWTAHCLLVLLAGRASAQGLIPVPARVTRELGAYYMSRLGLAEGGFEYYAILSQRNIGGVNAYLQINALDARDSPRDAAEKISNVRAVYTASSLGGKVTVESFYRLIRCGEPTCFSFSRVLAAELDGPYGPTYPLTLVKSTMGSSGWLINAVQGVVNPLLSSEGERQYTDPFYKGFTLYHKVARAPHNPCSSAIPQTFAGSIAEFMGVPGLTCMASNGASVIVQAGDNGIISRMKKNPLPWNQCDGSLFLKYAFTLNSGPRIFRVIRSPGNVPLTIEIRLPPATQQCADFLDVTNTLLAVQDVHDFPFIPTYGPKDEILPVLAKRGFNGSCKPTYMYASYGYYTAGQFEGLPEDSRDPNYLSSFLPYNTAPPEVCLSMLSVNQPDEGTRDESEDQCAQLYFGNDSQLREGIVTYNDDDPDTAATSRGKSFLQAECNGTRYNLTIELLLPQIAVDFDAEKNFLLSTSEVKFHLDGVAANAASVLAVEAALATSGIIVARMIARSGLYRRRRVHSNLARASALVTAAVVITIFNIPNFALISRSLSNHDSQSTFTQVSVHDYRPSNFSAHLRAETHSFITVQGSRATAVIGLLLYSSTMLLCLYLTWTEFTEIIHRREAAESRLGQDALIADKDLLVQWRAADSLVYDTLHPKKVVESAQAYELDVMRRNLAHAAANPTASPQRGDASVGFTPRGPAPPTPARAQNSPLRRPQSQPDGRTGTPDLYPEV